ncbi:MAG: hypothetical protein ACKOGE_07385, partial [Actinomycetota bacterium]
MTLTIRTTLAAAAVVAMPAMALGGGVGADGLAVRVAPVAGDDARCALVRGSEQARAAVACRTIARAAVLENAAPVGPAVGVMLDPGRHDVTGLVQFRGLVSMFGPGGVQALVNMTAQGKLVFGAGGQVALVGITGTAPGTWLSMSGQGAWLYGATVTRARADAPTVSLRANTVMVYQSVVAATGHPTAMVAKGAGGIQFSTVSGGRLALGPIAAGADAQAPAVNGSVLAGGLVSWGGRPGIYNTAISTPQAQNASAVEVRDEPGAASPAVNYPYIALTSIWQRSCVPAISLYRPAAAGREATVLLAGSLLRMPAPGCPAAITGGVGNGAGRTVGTIVNTFLAPVAGVFGPVCIGLDAVAESPSLAGDPRVEGGLAGRDWPGGMMPLA